MVTERQRGAITFHQPFGDCWGKLKNDYWPLSVFLTAREGSMISRYLLSDTWFELSWVDEMSSCSCVRSSLLTSVKDFQVIGRRMSFCRIKLLLHLAFSWIVAHARHIVPECCSDLWTMPIPNSCIWIRSVDTIIMSMSNPTRYMDTKATASLPVFLLLETWRISFICVWLKVQHVGLLDIAVSSYRKTSSEA
jgi:hypothetical protein